MTNNVNKTDAVKQIWSYTSPYAHHHTSYIFVVVRHKNYAIQKGVLLSVKGFYPRRPVFSDVTAHSGVTFLFIVGRQSDQRNLAGLAMQ